MLRVPESTVRKAASGDMGAFEELYRASSSYVFSVAYRVLGSREDAEEVAQDVFIKVYRKISSFSFRCAFTTWLYRVTMNTAINLYRKRSRERARNTRYDDNVKVVENAPAACPENSIEKKENEQIIMSMLKDLPEKHRTCIILRDIEGLKYEEISEVLGIGLNTVRSRISRARAKLISKYGASGEGL